MTSAASARTLAVVPRQLKDMVVAITGASSGIGRTLAQQLDARGAKLALCARRLDRLEELNRELGDRHLLMRVDVAAPAECAMFVRSTLEHFGRLDTLVANAGYGQYRLTHEMSGDDVRKMFATNVFGTTDLIHAAIPHMLTQAPRDGAEGVRGQVMIVSSAAARRGVPYLGPYAATKAAQLSIAEAMRVELRGKGIAVTSVHPVMTKTEFGEVAEMGGDVKLPRMRGPSQTVDHVARTMLRAIERPKPEVWPHQLTRIEVAFAALFPRVADFVMSKYHQSVSEANQ
jgi:short-subunit dehydrogenase